MSKENGNCWAAKMGPQGWEADRRLPRTEPLSKNYVSKTELSAKSKLVDKVSAAPVEPTRVDLNGATPVGVSLPGKTW